MEQELDIFDTNPHLDLVLWRDAVDAAGNKAAREQRDIAVFCNPWRGDGSGWLRLHIGPESDRPVGWKIVHVAAYTSRASILKQTLVIVAVALGAVLLLVRAVCNAR